MKQEYAYGYDNNGFYTGEVPRQWDQLDKKWLMPRNSTLVEPLDINDQLQRFDQKSKKWVLVKDSEVEMRNGKAVRLSPAELEAKQKAAEKNKKKKDIKKQCKAITDSMEDDDPYKQLFLKLVDLIEVD